MNRILLVVLVAVACKKSEPQGLPPAKDWGSGSSAAAQPAQPTNGQEMPANHPPMQPPAGGAPKTLAKLPDGKLALGPYAIAAPADWSEVPTTSQMRAGQFKIGDD